MPGRVDFTAHTNPLMAVACPKCQASVGSYCRRPSGHSGPIVGFHRERKAEADRIWLAQGDPPIQRTKTGWRYCWGEAEDSAPGSGTKGQAPPPAETTQPSLF